MRYRLSSLVLVVTSVWLFVGVGFYFEPVEFVIGQVANLEEKTERYRTVVLRDASLALSASNSSYESLVVVGDVLLARNVEFLMRQHNFDYPYQGLDLTTLAHNPAVLGNFEASVPKEHVPTPMKQITFSVDKLLAETLADNNFSHVSLANNHSFDFGHAGLSNTRQILSESLITFGDPNESNNQSGTVLEINGYRVGLFGLNGLVKIDSASLKKQLHELSKISDFQIVYVHWGEEYALRHSKGQRAIAEELILYGTDLIIGHHPHVVQGVDLIEGVPVFYSLGNYIFDQYFSKDVQEGLVLAIDFTDDISISLVPVSSKKTLSQPALMTPSDHALFLEKMANRSHPDLKHSVSNGLITIDRDIASSDKVAIIQSHDTYVE